MKILMTGIIGFAGSHLGDFVLAQFGGVCWQSRRHPRLHRRPRYRARVLAGHRTLHPGDVYNICSGKGYAIKEVLSMLLALSTRKNIKVETDPPRLRPSDVPVLIGDCAKFREITGWQATTPFERTLKDSLDYWRDRP